jgi:hypothetical protein
MALENNVPKVGMMTLAPCRNPSGRFGVTLERLARLESVMLDEIKELGKLVNGK